MNPDASPPTSRLGRGLESLCATLFSELWDLADYDRRLRIALATSLSSTFSLGVCAYLAPRDVFMGHFKREQRPRKNEIRRAFMEDCAPKLQTGRTAETALKDGLRLFVVKIPEELGAHGVISRRAVAPLPGTPNACGVLYSPEGEWAKIVTEEQFQRHHGLVTLKMLFEVFRQRERRFMAFPSAVSEAYWDESATPEPKRLRPPWDIGNLRTVTLVFDLRRSTFSMEHAASPQRFGEWLDELVSIVVAVTQQNGGVFDKFTGDGALVHFLEQECKRTRNCSALEAAVNCAADILRAMDRHIEKLREFLRFDSERLGAGVAIDVGEVYWYYDHRDNPITVGRSIVGACRMVVKAAAGKVRLSNIAYRELPDSLRAGLKDAKAVPFTSKELGDDLGVKIWECELADFSDLGHSKTEIHEMCSKLYSLPRRRADKL